MTKSELDILEQAGWIVLCESPLEIELQNEEDPKSGPMGFASGQAAKEIIAGILKEHKVFSMEDQGQEEFDILESKGWHIVCMKPLYMEFVDPARSEEGVTHSVGGAAALSIAKSILG